MHGAFAAWASDAGVEAGVANIDSPRRGSPLVRAWMLGLVLLAGCLGAQPSHSTDTALHARASALASLALVTDHDHTDPTSHSAAVGMSLASFFPLQDILQGEPGRASDLQFSPDGKFASVTVNGGSGGFVLLDATNAPNLTVISRYHSGSEDNWYTKFTPDGKFILLTANGNFAPATAATSFLEGLQKGTVSDGVRGIHVVDVTEPKRPRLAFVWPAPVRVINAWAEAYGSGETFVFASIIEDRTPTGAARSPGALSNYVQVLQLANDGKLSPVARWAPDKNLGSDTLVHDVIVQTHPLTGRRILYAAGWDSGAWLVDVTSPSAPETLAHVRPPGAPTALGTHTVKPYPALLGGRHVTLMSPETFAGAPSGDYVLLDTSDPAKPAILDSWRLPGNLTNAQALLWSPHEFSLANGKAYTSNYHAGTWVLDISGGKLVPTAVYDAAPAGWTPRKESVKWAVDAETTVWHAGYVYVVDMGQGVLALRETGT